MLQTGKIVKGVLEVTRKFVSTKEYAIDNKSEHDRDVHRRTPGASAGWVIVGTPAALPDDRQGCTVFNKPSRPGNRKNSTVKEENVQGQSIELVSSRLEDAQFYSQAGEIPAPVREALTKAATLKQAAAESQRAISEREEQVKTLASDQNRIRENLRTVGKTGDFATRQLKKLDDEESSDRQGAHRDRSVAHEARRPAERVGRLPRRA